MRVEWFGQSAFRLSTAEQAVFIDPFDDLGPLRERGVQWDYPAIDETADLVIVTHEHLDHNGIGAIGGDPTVVRSTAGRHESPVGELLGVASEHDEVAGTERGPNTIYSFDLDGLRVCHFGDFGQAELRPEQEQALGSVDLLFVPVGDGPTIGGEHAAALARRLGARWVVPMHYRTERIGFLEPADAFLDAIGDVHRPGAPAFDTASLPAGDGGPVGVVPAAP